MRVSFDLAALISADVEQVQRLFAGSYRIDDSIADLKNFASHVKTLDPSAVDYAVPFGAVTSAAYLVFLAYAPVTVRLNGIGSPAMTVGPVPAASAASVLSSVQRFDQPGWIVWGSGAITSLHVSNPSSSVAASFAAFLVGETTPTP